jgi:ornithine cyclodeaminase
MGTPTMLVVNRAQVAALLDLDTIIDNLTTAMTALSSGAASAPNRNAALVPDRDGFLAAMPR